MTEDNLLDCHLLSLQNIENDGGKLTFTIVHEDPIQYPPEYYLHFLNITITSEGNSVEFCLQDYQNITFRGNKMIFHVILPFSGQLHINAKCGTRSLNDHINVDSLYIYYASLSRMERAGTDVARYNNVCLENNTLTFMECAHVKMRSEFEFDGQMFKVNETNTTFEEYMNETNATFVNETSYFIADFNGDVFHDYFAVLNPILSSFLRDSAPKNSSFVLSHEPSNETISRICQYAPNARLVKRRDGPVCYRNLVFTNAKSTMNKKWFDSLIKIPFTNTISRFKLRTAEEKKIVVASSLWSSVGQLQELCDDCEFYEFRRNELDLEQIAALMSSANVFIANHVKDLVFLTLMDGSSRVTVIDASDPSYSCQEWSERISGTVRYIRVYSDTKKCDCNDFQCYPEDPEETDVSADIGDVFVDALAVKKYKDYV